MSKFLKKVVIVSLLGYRAIDPTIFMSCMLTKYAPLNKQEEPIDTYYIQKREQTLIIRKTNHTSRKNTEIRERKIPIKKIEAEIATLTEKNRVAGLDSELTHLGQQMKYLSGSLLCGTYRER